MAHAPGGRAADALDSLAASLRERLGVVAEAHALSAQARYSALVVGIGPLVYLGFSMVVDRRGDRRVDRHHVGRLCAVAALALEGCGRMVDAPRARERTHAVIVVVLALAWGVARGAPRCSASRAGSP